MRNRILFLLCLVVLMAMPGAARAFEATITPERVKQGDPFLVKITGAFEKPQAVFQGADLKFSACGKGCFSAIGTSLLKSKAGIYSLFVYDRKQVVSLPLEVTEGVFPVTRITVDEEKVKLSPEDEKRADREEARLKALWELKTERLWSGGFLIPLRNSYSTLFGTKRIFNNEKESVHSGLDIRGRHGESVWASNRGRVVVAEELFFGGNTVVLDHGLGIYTIYMHLSEIKVAVDDIVEKGKVVGLVGSTGRSTGPHLHFSVKIGSTSTNPLAMTKLPLFGL